MRFLKGTSGQAVVEWIVGLIIVVAVVGTVSMSAAQYAAIDASNFLLQG